MSLLKNAACSSLGLAGPGQQSIPIKSRTQRRSHHRKPNFLIVGAAKAGTTSLYEYLRQHPQVFMPENKEPTYFVEGRYGFADFDSYLDLFAEAKEAQAVGEASGAYLASVESPEWIRTSLGPVKIIILLRDPARRAFSLYTWMAREGYENAPNFAEALRREPIRLADPQFRSQCPQFFDDYLYFSTGLYFEQVKRYLDAFGTERVRVYFFEEFIRNPLTVCRDVFRFLEIEEQFTPRIEVHNAGASPYSAPLQSFLRPALQPGPSARSLPRRLVSRLARGMADVNLWLGKFGETRLTAAEHAQLLDRYSDDSRNLGDLLNRDLSALWRKRP